MRADLVKRIKTFRIAFLIVIGSAFFVSLAITSKTRAIDYCDPAYTTSHTRSHSNYCNDAEQSAYTLCLNGGGGRSGAIWFNNVGSYYTDEVDVAGGATSVGVNINGSFDSCGNNTNNDQMSAYYINTKVNNHNNPILSTPGGLPSPGAADSIQLYRGYTNAKNQFSTLGSSVAATLDVSNMAINANNNYPGCPADSFCQKTSLNLYRCPVLTPSVKPDSSECYTTSVPINVIRNPIPVGNFTLTPGVNLSAQAIEAGQDYTATPWVKNDGESTSAPADWWLMRKVGNGSYVKVSSGNSTFLPNGTPANLTPYVDNSTDYPAGTKICYNASVQPYTNSSSDKATSNPDVCVVIGKSPKVQIWGGDLVVRGDTDTSTSVKANMFGSWVEYAIFAGGTINGTASGSVFAGIAGSPGLPVVGGVSANQCAYSPLSFTNSGDSTCKTNQPIGGYNTNHLIPDVAYAFPVSDTTTLQFNSGGALGQSQYLTSGIYKTGGDVSIIASNITSGHWYVINAGNSTVTISGNIEYNSGNSRPYSSIYDIPQVIIIAGKIIIADNVTNVDAWLVATKKDGTGSIQTCANEVKTIGACNNLLTVDGPVMTDKLYLYRTAGSGLDAASGDPAEVFNLRADAYLWAYAHVSKAGNIQTVYTTELPPRF